MQSQTGISLPLCVFIICLHQCYQHVGIKTGSILSIHWIADKNQRTSVIVTGPGTVGSDTNCLPLSSL